MKTLVFSGGVGGARFLTGLVKVINPADITVISNTGDDCEFYNLYICPDIDIVIYTLAGEVDPVTGWGIENDSFHTLAELSKFGCDTWFQLGDRDLATHLYRSMLIRQGMNLTDITSRIVQAKGLSLSILPMSNQRVETMIDTGSEILPFQEYMVKRRFQTPVSKILFRGAENASPTQEVLEIIRQAEQIILAPSNPYVSIGAILAVPGIRRALEQAPGKIAAISPIVGARAIKGPAALMLQAFGRPVSPVGIAGLYRDFLDIMVVDEQDAFHIPEIEAMGIHTAAADTMMISLEAKMALAKRILDISRHMNSD